MPFDVLVIGGGPAGLSAAVNVRARGKTVLVVSNPSQENPLWKSERVDNYLGLSGVSGQELLTAFSRHAEASGAEIRTGKALNAAYAAEIWYVSVGSDVLEAKAVILAAGVSRAKKLPGEEEFLGRGVSYCATCDGMLYREKSVAVLGWSETASQEADYLRSIGCTVRYFDRPRHGEITGDTVVRSVTCDGETAQVDGVFVLRPTMAPVDLFPGLALEEGYVAVDRKMATNLPGLFAAGDCTGGLLQVSKAVGEGLIAGQSAAKWIDANQNARLNKR